MRAFNSEWVKLLRLRQMLSVWGTMMAFAVLVVVLFMANAQPPAPAPAACTGANPDPAACQAAIAQAQIDARRTGPNIPIATFEKASGLSFGMSLAGDILGIVTLVLFAGSMAGEYGNGTLKVLLSRQPRRLQLLGGKLSALLAFAAVGLLLTAVVQVLAAIAVGAARGFDLSSWWTAGAWGDLFGLVARLVVSLALWGTLGAMLAILLRSGPASIGIGIAYVMVVEGLLGLVLPDVVKYLPGSVISTFTAWGNSAAAALGASTAAVSNGMAAALMALYLALFLGVSGVIFRQRDVST